MARFRVFVSKTASRQAREIDEVERPGLRRLVLPKTRYYVYFRIIEGENRVQVVALWHTSRGDLPPLDE